METLAGLDDGVPLAVAEYAEGDGLLPDEVPEAIAPRSRCRTTRR